jgi:outer membrane protein
MIKKIITLSLLVSSMLIAKDTYIEVGAGYLQQNMKTDISINSSTAILDNYSISDSKGADSGSLYGYIDFQAIPILPNIKVDFSNPDFESDNIEASYTVNGNTNSVNTLAKYQLTTQQLGGYIYYDLLSFLDNFSLDIGVGAKYIDYDLYIKDKIQDKVVYSDSDTLLLPLVYIHPDIRYKNFIIEFEGKGISYDGDIYYDLKTGVKYLFDTSIGKVGLEGGYYYSKLEVHGDTDINSNSEGYYAGLIYKF